MQRAKKKDVIAVGPAFGSDSDIDSRRVMLVKNRDEEGDTKEYVVISKKKPRGQSAPGARKIMKTQDFTHAVRMFCDRILDQAWSDDLRHEGELPS